MTRPTVPPAWVHRDPPLTRAAVTAVGPAAHRLAAATTSRLDAGVTGLRAAGSRDRLVVLGDADALPWCDGARYLGWEAGVLVPTGARPTLPTELLAARARRVLDRPGLVVLLPDAVVGSSMPRREVDRTALQAWSG